MEVSRSKVGLERQRLKPRRLRIKNPEHRAKRNSYNLPKTALLGKLS